jgi:hypothetical protein
MDLLSHRGGRQADRVLEELKNNRLIASFIAAKNTPVIL